MTPNPHSKSAPRPHRARRARARQQHIVVDLVHDHLDELAAAAGLGQLLGGVDVDEDPAGHSCCVFPETTWGVLQVRDTTNRDIFITLDNVVEGIDLTSPLGGTGEQFRAVGVGSVAGFDGTEVAFEGTVTPEEGMHGTLTVGGNGTLPTGQSITFTVDMAKAA